LSDRLLAGTDAPRTARIWQPADILRAGAGGGGFTATQWKPAAKPFEMVPAEGRPVPPSQDVAPEQPPEHEVPALAASAPVAAAPPEPANTVSQQTLEEARLQAYAEGQEFGRHEAEKQARESAKAEQTLLQNRLTALEQALHALGQTPERLHEPLKRLALHLAEQLVLGELTQSPQAIERLVRRCVDELASRRAQVLVELHPDDLALLQPLLLRLAADDSAAAEASRAGAPPWQLQADASLQPGSVRASADDAVVSDLVEHRLDALARQLLLDPQRQARNSAFAPERLAARRADVDAVLDAQPRMAESSRSNRFSPVVEAQPVASPRMPDPAPPPPDHGASAVLDDDGLMDTDFGAYEQSQAFIQPDQAEPQAPPA